MAELVEVLARYGLTSVSGDAYAGAWVSDAFRARGVEYRALDGDKSRHYLSLLASVNSGGIELPDHAALLRELRGLERRRGATRDRIDHRAGAGAHDDLACCVAGLAEVLAARRELPADMRFDDCLLGTPRKWVSGESLARPFSMGGPSSPWR